MSAEDRPTPPPGFVEAIRELAARSVKPRFGLDADAFARRVLEVVRGTDPVVDPEGLRLDDLYLATACAAGDETAWAELSRLHFDFIRDFALRCVRRDPPASDVAERVIGDLWQRGKIAQFSGRSSLRTWLGTVVAHTASNALKDARRSAPLGAASRRTPAASAFEADPSAHERFAGLVAAELGALAPDDRLLLLFHYERGMSLQEIARFLRSSKASLSRRLKRLREAVRVGIEARLRSAVGTDSEAFRKSIDLGRVELDLASVLREAEPEQQGPRNV